MRVMTEVHPFLDGKPKRMLIDGKWVLAASGTRIRRAAPRRVPEREVSLDQDRLTPRRGF